MRQTTLKSPSPYSGKDFKGMTPLAKFHGRREARVKSRREAHTLIAEQVEAAFEPPRDFAAEWDEARWALDCGNGAEEADAEELEEFAALWYYGQTGEFLPV